MSAISDFVLIDDLGDYDRRENPLHLSVMQLLADGVSWVYMSEKHEFTSPHKIIATLLPDASAIALVVAPFDRSENKALVLSADGSVRWDVGQLIGEAAMTGIFADVYEVSGQLCFFVNIQNQDFRCSFDVASGSVGALVQSF